MFRKTRFQAPHLGRIKYRNLHVVVWRYIVVALIFISASCHIAPVNASAHKCYDIEFIFARGSGEELGGPSASAWQTEIERQVSDLGLNYHFYELGQSRQGGYQYPAVAVAGGLGEIMNLLGAAVSGGSAFAFGESVRQGVGELKAYINNVAQACPNARFILGGYSQGAMIVSQTLPNLDASKIIYAATFGDPKVYLPEGKSKSGTTPKYPDACQGKNLSPYRVYVPDCYTYEGVLGSYRPYQPAGYLGKLGTWCNQSDLMCSSGMSIDDHVAYVSENLYSDAAREALKAIQAAYAIPAPIPGLGLSGLHDVAIVIDTTGSMRGLIDQYKSEAQNLALQVKNEGGRVALFEYRDLAEGFEPKKLCDFNCSTEELTAKIDHLSVAGGGDDPESSLSAAMAALNSLDWQNGATKSIVLLTDAGFHNPDRDGTTLPEIVQRSLEIDPVNIYVMTTSANKTTYQELTRLTNGAIFDVYDELTLSTQTILSRPVALLSLPNYTGLVGDEFTFDASRSYSLRSDDLQFDWDLDGDGEFELEDAGPTITTTYSKSMHGYVQVKVSDGFAYSTMSAQVNVTTTAPAGNPATVNNVNAKWLSADAAELSFTTDAAQSLLFLDDAPLGFIKTEDGRAVLKITDLTQPAVATIVPYSSDGRRGLSTAVELSKHSEIKTPPTTVLAIPKAPNAGVKNP